jgi:hypothetical protein
MFIQPVARRLIRTEIRIRIDHDLANVAVIASGVRITAA